MVVAAFLLSRVGYYLAGVRFDASPLPWYLQYLDPALLTADLGQGIWYLHSQPPVFNLFLGIVLNLFPGRETAVFTLCYLYLGLVFATTLFRLLRGFGVSDVQSAVLATIYVTSPACVLYENWLFYTYPLTVFLLLAALFWERFVTGGEFGDALLFFSAAAVLALTWSLFHLVWLLGLVLMLVLLRRRDWRKVLAAAAVPVLVVTFWYGKNLTLFGQFTGSTWFGMNFSKITNSMLTAPERRELHDSGRISAVSLTPPFSSLDRYGRVEAQPRGIPVLDQQSRMSGYTNFNNKAYIAVSRQYGRDAQEVLRAKPAAYLRGLATSYLIYLFRPASTAKGLDSSNASHVRALDRLYSIVFNGQFVRRHDRSLRPTQSTSYYLQGLLGSGWFLVIAYVLVLTAGLGLLFRRSSLAAGAPVEQRSAYRSTLAFLWSSIAWVTFVANFIEVGENNRFRFVTDPLVFVFLAGIVSAWLAGRRRGGTNKHQ